MGRLRALECIGLAVRVRLRIGSGNREALFSALVNSGFEADEPQLILPYRLAGVLGLS
ncbi:hypothetical protein KEJ13_08655 [Candidatus Bathyarchaeota archaeon]|nr:hypothetical protein [Candidatus Bathyarchaeota archaeon]